MRTRARILTVGDSGVGKSSLLYRICHGKPATDLQAEWTVGCNVEVKLCGGSDMFLFGNGESSLAGSGGSEGNIAGIMQESAMGERLHAQEPYFVEFLDVGCHNNHELSRKMYYGNVDGILLVYDVSNSKSFVNLRKWVNELRKYLRSPAEGLHSNKQRNMYHRAISSGTGPSSTAPQEKQICSLPVLVVGNKLDVVAAKKGILDGFNVARSLGFESVNVSSTARHQCTADFERIEAFIRHVVDSRQGEEVNYSSISDHITSGMALP